MKKLFLIVTLAILLASDALAQSTQTKFTVVNNSRMAYKVFGLGTRTANQPIVVFESGIGTGGGNFEPIFQHLPKEICWFTYDRNGLGESEPDNSLASDSDVVGRLHDLLTRSNIPPPYILVGHSIGGAFIRLFESKYPAEIAGMVFIDPTDFMLTAEENEAARIASGSKIGYRELIPVMLSEMASDSSMPEGVRQEMKRELDSNRPYFREYQNLSSIANIPVAVLLAYNRHIEKFEQDMNARLGISGRAWFEAFDGYRVAHFSKLVQTNDKSFIMLLPQYSHGIHNQDPKLAADVIARIYYKN